MVKSEKRRGLVMISQVCEMVFLGFFLLMKVAFAKRIERYFVSRLS